MAVLIRSMADWYNHIFHDLTHPEATPFFLFRSPIPVFLTIVLYMYFITKLGPKLMEKRQPYSLIRFIQVFNVIQMIVCGWLTLGVWIEGYGPNGKLYWSCPVNMTRDPYVKARISYYFHSFLLIKLLDLVDTIVFVLRKNYHQISFLHVSHHVGMVFNCWLIGKYFQGGLFGMIAMVNSFVHTVMYAYYFYSTISKPSNSWKKYVTVIQMAQFLFITMYFGSELILPTCDSNRVVVGMTVVQGVILFTMFANFYFHAYILPKPKKNKNEKTK